MKFSYISIFWLCVVAEVLYKGYAEETEGGGSDGKPVQDGTVASFQVEGNASDVATVGTLNITEQIVISSTSETTSTVENTTTTSETALLPKTLNENNETLSVTAVPEPSTLPVEPISNISIAPIESSEAATPFTTLPPVDASIGEPDTTSATVTSAPTITSPFFINDTEKVVDKLSDQIRKILKHFQNPEEFALPGDIMIPDPMSVPNVTESVGFADGTFYNITVHEQSKFSVETINTDLDEMQVYVSLRMKRLIILGNYTMSGIFMGSSEGPFNVTMTDVSAEGTVFLARDSQGAIYANKSTTNMVQNGINAQFVNASNVFQGLINVAATILFMSVKPHVLSKVDEKICHDINDRLSTLSLRLPTTPWSPVDLAVLEGRKYVRKMGYDPLVIKNIFKFDEKFLTVKAEKFTVKGLSRFKRVGNVTLLMENGTLQFGVRMITGRLEGKLDWFYDFGKIGIIRNGSSTFSISHLQVHAVVNQSVDIRQRPVLHSLEIETGPVGVKMDGEGSFDYIVEYVMMLLPKMVRHMIVDSLEIPIKYQIQQILTNIDVEDLVDNNLSSVDLYVQTFKLSSQT